MRAIAEELNGGGVTTLHDGSWHASIVRKIGREYRPRGGGAELPWCSCYGLGRSSRLSGKDTQEEERLTRYDIVTHSHFLIKFYL